MLTLTRQVKVEAFVALAEIGVPSQREEILAVLKLAAEHGGYVKAEDVNTTLLGRPGESPHGQRILMLIESYGLLERTGTRENDAYRITIAGTENLQKGQIMIPEEGSYILFATTDPLFKEAILRIERNPFVEKNESQTYFGRKNDSSSREQTNESMARPSYLDKYVRGYVFNQAANSNAPLQVNSISDRLALSSRRLIVTVDLELELDVDTAMKVGAVASGSSVKEVYAQTNFNRRYTQVLETVTADVGRLEVLDGEPTLLVSWNSMNASEAERFRKEVKVENPTLWEFGTFESVNLTLPILPATEQDAVAWGNYLLRNSIRTYVDESAYLSARYDVAGRFAKKYDQSSLSNRLMKFEEMVRQVTEEKKAGDTSALYWYLIAPQDLSIR
jgi:hypothetical protein